MLRYRGTFQAALFVLSNARWSCHRPIARSRSLDLRGFLTRSTVDIQRAEQRGSRIVQLSPSLPCPCWTNKLERARFRAERVRTCFLFLLPSYVRAFSSLSIFLPHIRTRSPLLPFPPSLLSLSSPFLFLPYQAEGGSGHERAATLLLDSDAVAGAEVRRISIGFEPDADDRPKTP